MMKIYFNFKRIAFFFVVCFLVFGLVFAAPAVLYGQPTGFKYFKNYSRETHGIQHQNWSVLQGNNNIIYVANQGDLLVYDGVSWRSMGIPNSSVLSIGRDDNGIIYLGGKNEFGRIIPGERGTLKYESLSDRFKSDNQKKISHVGDTWGIHAAREGVYFQTLNFLFLWNPNTQQMRLILSGKGLRASFMCGEKLFIHQTNIGLHQLVKNSLKLVLNGEAFAEEEAKIYMMVTYDKETNRFLVGTKSRGLFIYDYAKGTINPFNTEIDEYIKEKELYHGICLSSSSTGKPDSFALATQRGGLVVIDSLGRLKYMFNKANGLPNDIVFRVFEDIQGNLWLALNKGISKIEYASPFSIYDDRSGLPGYVLSVIKHHNDLYVGTTNGLFFLTSSSPGMFQQIPEIPPFCRSLLSIGDSLLAATKEGIFLIKERRKEKEIIKTPSYVLLQSKRDAKRVWVGTRLGLTSLYRENNRWVKQEKIKNIYKEIRTIVEQDKSLWLGSPETGVYKVDFHDRGEKGYTAILYNKSDFLPANPGGSNVFWAAGHTIIAAANKGIFRFDEDTGSFVPDYTLGDELAGGENAKGVYRIAEDKNKDIWFHSDSQNFHAVFDPRGKTFTVHSNSLLRIPRIQVDTIYPDPDGRILWFGSHDGLIRFDKTVKKNYNFQTLIRKVVINGKPWYDGNSNSKFKPIIPLIPHNDRNIRFEFAAPSFVHESLNQYKYLLEGYEKTWSEWTSEPNIYYTNLDARLYTFKVQARNVYEQQGREATFQFRVLPHWSQTWWAFLFYMLAFFLMMFFIVKWRSGKLRREKQKLERIVKDRTREIEEKSQQLETQTLQLKEQSEKLKEVDRVKSRFFANISHEFRTPLTLIMGPLEHMLSESQDKKKEKQLNLMLRNSQRLLGLIDQLMELSKFESGTMKLQACQQNIIPFLRGIVASFEPVAAKNELDLAFQTGEENITLYFDPGKLEEVIFNLLSNAIKFTPPGGKITVNAARIPTKEENFPSGSVNIAISDTGPGIPRDQLAHIFDRFYQSDTTYEHHLKGSGIGLSIAKELVELHHGRIDVHSHEGKGTGFISRLPLGDSHLNPEEIVEPLEKPYIPRTPKGIPAYAGPAQVEIERPGTVGREEECDPLKPGKNIILVVEDSEDVREYIKAELEPLYTVVEAKDGQEALQKAQEIIPDLIISDVMMPGTDGYELCRELKNNINTSHVPIILLTAKASEESIIKGLETGADDYITKPFNTKILCARIKNLIDLRTHMQQTLKREMTQQPIKISMSQNDKTFIKQLKKVIDKNISDPDFNVTQMCKDMDMSQPTLYRKIYALSGESPTEFIRSYRLKRGAELLKNNFGTVLEVAFEVGFSSANYFTKCFKKMFHQLPSSYQASEGE